VTVVENRSFTLHDGAAGCDDLRNYQDFKFTLTSRRDAQQNFTLSSHRIAGAVCSRSVIDKIAKLKVRFRSGRLHAPHETSASSREALKA
jgi:hypothetical protein